MVLANRENKNSDKIQKKNKENITKEKVDKVHNGLNILAAIMTRDIYKKRIRKNSNK